MRQCASKARSGSRTKVGTRCSWLLVFDPVSHRLALRLGTPWPPAVLRGGREALLKAWQQPGGARPALGLDCRRRLALLSPQR